MVFIPRKSTEELFVKTIRVNKTNKAKLAKLSKDTKRSENEVVNLLIEAAKVEDVGVRK